MSKPTSGTIRTADITVDLEDGRQVETTLGDGSPILVRRLFIHMEKDDRGVWSEPVVSGSAARRKKRSGSGEWRKAYYELSGFDMTPAIDGIVDDAVRKVKADAAEREQA